MYKVYILSDNGIIKQINSGAFINDFTNWIEVDEGDGDKFHHAQGNYLTKQIIDDNGIYNYKYEGHQVIERTEEEKTTELLQKQAEAEALLPDPNLTIEERLTQLELLELERAEIINAKK